MALISKQRKIQHLYLRAGFNENISNINKVISEPLKSNVGKLFQDSKSYSDLSIDKELASLKIFGKDRKKLSEEEKKKLRREARQNIMELNTTWIEKMVKDKAQLREKMTLFWHGHFACRSPLPLLNQLQNNTIRKYSLGRFGDLLMAVSKDPAMLQFLNNQQNRKSSPNENFARELLELFTIGRGNYTEDDIKNAARAFTGWGFNYEGEFVFRKMIHDSGQKTFMGKTGNFDGEDIINIVLENRKTSEFITNKLYKYFVNGDINIEIADKLSRNFYESGYDIKKLMEEIFLSDWFYDSENVGTKIKSPIEFIAGLIRTFNISLKNNKPLLGAQKVLSQILFFPPNVSGWAGGRSWIDSSSLMTRLKIPEVLFRSSELDFDYKGDSIDMEEMFDAKGQKRNRKSYRKFKSEINLKDYVEHFSNYDNDDLFDKLAEHLLQTDLSSPSKNVINKYADNSSKENMIESITLKLISMPEYQLC